MYVITVIICILNLQSTLTQIDLQRLLLCAILSSNYSKLFCLVVVMWVNCH